MNETNQSIITRKDFSKSSKFVVAAIKLFNLIGVVV